MGMRYRRPNRRRHKPNSPRTQVTAVLLGLGALLAPFTYGITLLAALLLVSCRFLRQ